MKITGYDFGKITIEGKAYTSDVIVTPEEVRASWWRKEGHRLHREDLDEVVRAKPEVLVVGTGYYGRMSIPSETEAFLKSKGIRLLGAPTGEAVREFNRLQETTRAVAALHLTC
jgi:hypothetical protein